MPGQRLGLRKRRSVYTTVACEKCQRSKTKCSGSLPCMRCQDTNSACLYPRATRFRSPRRKLCKELPVGERGGQDAARAPSLASADVPRLWPSDIPLVTASLEEDQGTGSVNDHLLQVLEHRNASRRILGLFDRHVWDSILQIYEEEVGLMYPFLDIQALSGKIDAASELTPVEHVLEDIVVLVLGVISGVEELGSVRLLKEVEAIFSKVIVRVHLHNADLDDLRLLTIICIYFFLSDDEKRAWGIIGVIMRTLHANHIDGSITVPDKFFWTVYTLDRRWSLGTGLPFAIQDADIFHRPLSITEEDLSSAYLNEMVSLCRVASIIHSSFLSRTTLHSSELDSTRNYAHFCIIQWQKNLPQRLQFNGTLDKLDTSKETRGCYKLRLMLYLRANQLRTLVLRKAATLFGPEKLDTSQFRDLAEIAQDSIRVLTALVRDTDIYTAQHKTFNRFLETALSSLLLVTCYGSVEHGKSCFEAVAVATELVHRLARRSPITEKLKHRLQHVNSVIDRMKLGSMNSMNYDETVIHQPVFDTGVDWTPVNADTQSQESTILSHSEHVEVIEGTFAGLDELLRDHGLEGFTF